MNSRHIVFTVLFGASILGLPFSALSEPASSSNTVSKTDIDKFCSKSTHKPKPGLQFDGKKASSTVMQLQAGRYNYPNEGAMLLFPNKHYLIKLPSNRTGIYGTDGDDILFAGGIVGGCSLEQLSESISKNALSLDAFNLIKAYY